MKSYVTPYATPARSSLVRTARRPLVSMSRLSELQEQPWAVFVDPHVEHVVTTYRLGFDIWTQIGARLYRNREDPNVEIVMGRDRLIEGGRFRHWNGRPRSGVLPTGDITLALDLRADHVGAILLLGEQHAPREIRLPDGSPARSWGSVPARVRVSMDQLFVPGKKTSKGPAAALSRRTAARSLPCLTDVSSSSTP